jgi:hypothetical protein
MRSEKWHARCAVETPARDLVMTRQCTLAAYMADSTSQGLRFLSELLIWLIKAFGPSPSLPGILRCDQTVVRLTLL